MGLVQVLLGGHRGSLGNAVGVVQHHAQIADAAHAGLRTHRRLTHLDARVAEDALLRLAALPVVVDLLVRAGRHAHAPAAALVLVDQHDAIFLALVDRARRARRHARRVQAVLAQARQVHHEGLFEGAVDLLLHLVEVVVARALAELRTQDFLPVRAPLDLLHALATDQRTRPRGGLVLAVLGGVQVLVVEIKRLVVVVDLWQVRVGEDLGQHPPAAAGTRHQLAGAGAHPAAVPLVLVLPFLGVADARLGFHVVEPGVLDALARGPDVLAGDRAGVAADALVQVQHHRDLCTDLHHTTSLLADAEAPAGCSSSNQSILSILRTITNSSRLVPHVP